MFLIVSDRSFSKAFRSSHAGADLLLLKTSSSSRKNESYISLTAHCLNENFKFKHRVLSTLAKIIVVTFRICLVIRILP